MIGKGIEEDGSREWCGEDARKINKRSGAERGIFQAEVPHHIHQLHLDITGSTCV